MEKTGKLFPDLYIEENEKIESILTAWKLMGGKYHFFENYYKIYFQLYSRTDVKVGRVNYKVDGTLSIQFFGKYIQTKKDYLYLIDTYMKILLRDGVDYNGRDW